MIYLNDINNGKVIQINKIKDSGIYYTLFTNTYFRDNNLYGESFRIDYPSKDFQSTLINPTLEQVEEEAIAAKFIELYPEFVSNNDSQNWIMSEKAFRVIANEKLIWHIGNKTDLGQLFLALQDEFIGQYFVYDGITYIYASNINPLYEPIFLAYPDTITIESKII